MENREKVNHPIYDNHLRSYGVSFQCRTNTNDHIGVFPKDTCNYGGLRETNNYPHVSRGYGVGIGITFIKDSFSIFKGHVLSTSY